MKEAKTIPIEGGNLKSLANTTTSTAGKEKAVEEAGSFQVSSLLPLQMGACHSSMARFHTGCVKHIANSEPGSNLISLPSTHCPMWDDGIIYTIGIASIQLFIKNVMSLC